MTVLEPATHACRKLTYQLDTDMVEAKDQTGAQPELSKKLEARLDAWLKDVGANFPRGR